MRNNSWRLLLAVPALVLFGTACGPTQRYVTATHWYNGDTMYMAYAEVNGSSVTPKVQKCSRGSDNGLACTDQANLNASLQPK